MKTRILILALGLLLVSPPRAEALVDGVPIVLKKACKSENRTLADAFANVLCTLFLGMPVGLGLGIAEMASEPLYGFDGTDHFMGLQKEFAIRIRKYHRRCRWTWKEGRGRYRACSDVMSKRPSAHHLVITPVALFNLSNKSDHIFKLRMGYQYRWGILLLGLGVSLGLQLPGTPFVAGGPELKLHYDFWTHSRFYVAVRYEYGLKGHELNSGVGISLVF